MQLVFDLKTIVIGTVVAVVGYHGYQYMFGELEGKSVSKLIQLYGSSQPTRRMVIKRRAVSIYTAGRDFEVVDRALDSISPAEQALAVTIFRERQDRRVTEKLIGMLRDDERGAMVKEELAATMAEFKVTEAIPRLIELTDVREQQGVRAAAHSALKVLTGAGGQVKLGEATRQSWANLWEDKLKKKLLREARDRKRK